MGKPNIYFDLDKHSDELRDSTLKTSYGAFFKLKFPEYGGNLI